MIKSTLQLNGAIERSTLKIGSFFIFKPIFDSSLQQNGIGEMVEAIATVLNDEEF